MLAARNQPLEPKGVASRTLGRAFTCPMRSIDIVRRRCGSREKRVRGNGGDNDRGGVGQLCKRRPLHWDTRSSVRTWPPEPGQRLLSPDARRTPGCRRSPPAGLLRRIAIRIATRLDRKQAGTAVIRAVIGAVRSASPTSGPYPERVARPDESPSLPVVSRRSRCAARRQASKWFIGRAPAELGDRSHRRRSSARAPGGRQHTHERPCARPSRMSSATPQPRHSAVRCGARNNRPGTTGELSGCCDRQA